MYNRINQGDFKKIDRLTSQGRNLQKHNTFVTALRQCWAFPRCQMTSGYMAVLFISIGRMLFLASTIDNAKPLFALVITPGFYLSDVEVADQDLASSSL